MNLRTTLLLLLAICSISKWCCGVDKEPPEIEKKDTPWWKKEIVLEMDKHRIPQDILDDFAKSQKENEEEAERTKHLKGFELIMYLMNKKE